MTLQNASASIRIQRANEAFHSATKNALDKLTENPQRSIRVSTKVAKRILIAYPTLTTQGRLYSTQVRNTGAGVKELYLKLMEES